MSTPAPPDAPSFPSPSAPVADHTTSVAERPSVTRASTGSSLLGDLWTLAKPEITFLVTLSAAAGFFLGSSVPLDLSGLLVTLVGVAFCAGGAGALNHYLERDLDARMQRTRGRALPAGRVRSRTAQLLGTGLVLAGIALLASFVNLLTTVLAGAAVGLYLFVYTPLKQKTVYNTFVGTLPGALPALGGYVAATGAPGAGGWAIFVILVTWQIPHFLSLAWMYRHDYARGGYEMIPVRDPGGHATARHMLGFTGLLGLASTAPFFLNATGWLYLVGALPLGGWFFGETLRFYRNRTGPQARAVLKASIYYIPLLLALIALDWWIAG